MILFVVESSNIFILKINAELKHASTQYFILPRADNFTGNVAKKYIIQSSCLNPKIHFVEGLILIPKFPVSEFHVVHVAGDECIIDIHEDVIEVFKIWFMNLGKY